MGYGVKYGPWDELYPDVLGRIFMKLPLEDILSVAPLVCKSWQNTVRGPCCWQEIDIHDWSRYRIELLDSMLLLLVSRSHGSLRKLCIYGLSSPTSLDLIAENAKSLENLVLRRSEISDVMVEKVASRFSALTCLDVSYCTKIGAPALEAFGKNCKLLTHLKRNMHPQDVIRRSQDDEAFAIASTMPNLKHLEVTFLRITIEGAARIVTSCHDLELLDLSGCWKLVKREEKFFDRFPKLKIAGPLLEKDDMDWTFSNMCGYGIDEELLFRTVTIVMFGSAESESIAKIYDW